MTNTENELSGTIYLFPADESEGKLEWKRDFSGEGCLARAYISVLLSSQDTIETKYIMVEINPDIRPTIKKTIREEYLGRGAIVTDAVQFKAVPFEVTYVQAMLGKFNRQFAESVDKYQATE